MQWQRKTKVLLDSLARGKNKIDLVHCFMSDYDAVKFRKLCTVLITALLKKVWKIAVKINS